MKQLSSSTSREAYMVSSLAGHQTLADGALLCRMSEPVARRLSSLGHNEPVRLRLLPGKWWVADVEVAAVNATFEPGGAVTRVEASSEEIGAGHAHFYCEVMAGPFDRRADVSGRYLATAGCPVDWLGDRASVIEIPAWIARRLAEQGMLEPFSLDALSGLFWVCGMSGGVCSTQDLLAKISLNMPPLKITDGPFATQELAEYAFDSLWEAP